MSADAKLKAYIDRILRCREAEDEAKQDTKEVYAELAAEGYEKAIVGQVVTFLRKREKDGDKVAEQSAKFDLYLEAYERPSHAHTRVERSDAGLNIVTKHTEITASPETAEEFCRPATSAVSGGEPSKPSSDVGGVKMDGCNHPGRPDAVSGMHITQSEQATNSNPQSDDGAIAEVKGSARLASADGVEPSLSVHPAEQPSKDQSNEVATDNNISAVVPTCVTGEGAASALPTNTDDGTEFVPPVPMKRLRYAHCFPELTKAEYGRLEFSISGVGIQKPIIRMGDVIVDGWARYNIARSHGIAYPVTSYHGKDVLLDVIEWQRAARNFTPAQERKIAADLAKEIPHRADDIMAAFGLAEALEAAE